MKKVLEWALFLVIVVVLPGGALLAVRKLAQKVRPKFLAGLFAFGMLASGCAYTSYDQKTGERKVSGFGSVMEIAAAERLQAEAYATRVCADDPHKCNVLWGPWAGAYGAGMMDTSGGVVWGGWPGQNGSSQKDIAALKESQKKTNSALEALNKKLKKGN